MSVTATDGDLAASTPAPRGLVQAGLHRAGVGLAGLLAAALLALPVVVLLDHAHPGALPAHLYLPLHTLAELLAVLVGFAICAVQWAAAPAHERGGRTTFLGGAFLAVAVLDLLHIFAFPGMPGVVVPSSTGQGIVYWLAARLWAVSAFVVAGLLPDRRRIGRAPVLVATVVFVGAVVLMGVSTGADRLLYRRPVGLTPLKLALEYGVGALALVGALLWGRLYRRTGERTQLVIAAALILTALSEGTFTLYARATDVLNLLGHVYKVAAYVLVFRALFVAAVLRPYARLDAAKRELERLHAHIQDELEVTIARLEEKSGAEARAREGAEAANRRLAALYAELDAAIAAVPDALFLCSPTGQIVRMNAAAERLAGGAAGDALVARLVELGVATPEGSPLAAADVPPARALRGETVCGEVLVLPRGGGRAWASFSAAPIPGPDGRPEGAVVAAVDVTALRELEQQREDLLRAVSHDLRTPLATILLQAQRLRRLVGGAPDDGALRSTDAIIGRTRRMNAMIQDLVDSARVEGGQLELRREAVSVGDFVREIVATTRGALDTGRVRVDVPAALPAVYADPDRLDRVITNLVSNALKYSPAGTEVRVGATAADGEVRLSIADSGPGIAAEDLPRIFDRFYRAAGTRRADGLGMGLYITRMLVEAHGGRLEVDSELGRGSTFTVVLPVAPPPPPPPQGAGGGSA